MEAAPEAEETKHCIVGISHYHNRRRNSVIVGYSSNGCIRAATLQLLMGFAAVSMHFSSALQRFRAFAAALQHVRYDFAAIWRSFATVLVRFGLTLTRICNVQRHGAEK